MTRNSYIAHFTPKEFKCKCGCGAGGIAEDLVLWLEALRRAWDGAVIVNSAMRCVEHNKAVGGAARSRHLIGCAADIRPGDDDFMGFANLVVRMAGTSDEGWEVITYPEKGFVHVGVPRECALKLWDRVVLGSGDKKTGRG